MPNYLLQVEITDSPYGEKGAPLIIDSGDFEDDASAIAALVNFRVGELLIGRFDSREGAYVGGRFAVDFKVAQGSNVVHSGSQNQFTFGMEYPIV